LAGRVSDRDWPVGARCGVVVVLVDHFRGCNVYVSTKPGRSTTLTTDYVVEKLVAAVESLAVSAAPIQQRVGNAWIDALVHLRPDDFDDPRAAALFTSIRDDVTAKGGVVATTDSMTDGEALGTAAELVELLGTITLTLAVEREPPAHAE
jgi:hypothetical protein